MNSAVMFSKASDLWETPRDLFDALHAEFGFDVDVAATRDSSLCGEYLGPDHCIDEWRDALTVPWRGFTSRSTPAVAWMNPPYSRCREFMEKAALERFNGVTTVCLVPSRTDTRWWHRYVWSDKTDRPYPGVEIRFIRGRLKFGGSKNSAPFPSVIVIFRGA